MFKNSVVISFRALMKEKWYAFINIAGLAAGVASCVVILAYVRHETSYDDFHVEAENIYKVVDTYTFSGQSTNSAVVAAPMGPAMVETFPEVVSSVRILKTSAVLSRDAETKFQEDRFLFADAGFFQVFSFPLLLGDPGSVLAVPYSLVLTEDLARKFFGNENPIGKRLKTSSFGGTELTVTGVAGNPPENSHIRYDAVTSYATLHEKMAVNLQNWLIYGHHTYVVLRPGISSGEVTRKLGSFIEEKIGRELAPKYNHHLVPITSIHLGPGRKSEMEPGGSLMYVFLFSIVGLFLMAIACINFINLATARSAGRAQEVGLRKVLGAHRAQLTTQFLVESILLTACAVFAAIGLIEILFPVVHQRIGIRFGWGVFHDWELFMGVPALIGVVGVAAGIYPALVLSRMTPLNALQTKLYGGRSRGSLRKVLVIFQFSITIILLIATGVVQQQLDFFRSRDLGFDREQLLVLPIQSGTISQQRQTVKNEFLQLPSVVSATTSSSLPGKNVGFAPFRIEGGTMDQNSILSSLLVDHDFIPTLGLRMSGGRAFSASFASDSTAFVINEAAVRQLGIESVEGAMGKQLEMGSPSTTISVAKKGPIIGVVKDFNFKSLHNPVDPMVLHIQPAGYGFFALKIRAQDVQETLGSIKMIVQRYDPAALPNYSFLDEDYDKQYLSEERLAELFGAFSLLAIFIAGLGLFGLASFMTGKRKKEVGIRKVLGSSQAGIVMLFATENVKLVLLAIAVAWPIAYVAVSRWLENFAYRVDLSWWIFALAGALALLIALLTVSFQAVKAARANPVEALRYE